MPLEKYYAGDQAFVGLARAYKTEWEKCNFKEELIAAVDGDIAIATVIFGTLGVQSVPWLEKLVPALDGTSPRQCLKSETGIKRLKECLLRMPR